MTGIRTILYTKSYVAVVRRYRILDHTMHNLWATHVIHDILVRGYKSSYIWLSTPYTLLCNIAYDIANDNHILCMANDIVCLYLVHYLKYSVSDVYNINVIFRNHFLLCCSCPGQSYCTTSHMVFVHCCTYWYNIIENGDTMCFVLFLLSVSYAIVCDSSTIFNVIQCNYCTYVTYERELSWTICN